MSSAELPPIFGRDEERRSVSAFLDRAPYGGPRGLVLEGPVGIGKSTLWAESVELARARGLRVLVARPAEAERAYPHAALADVLEPVLDAVLPELPEPRRRALEVALLRRGDAHERADPTAVAAAVRSALALQTTAGPLVVAVDDVQWLDRASAAALAFALRRLAAPRVVVLLARRTAEDSTQSPLETSVEHERLRLGPLSAGAIQALLKARLGRVLPRPTLLRVHEASGGNPFFALELARALGPESDPVRPIQVPDSLDRLVRARLRNLPPSTRQALVFASLLGRVTPGQIAAAGFADDVLEAALASKILEPVDGALRFTHPLLASALYQDLSQAERRSAHARAAGMVEHPLERARHLALATSGPDAAVAATLDEEVTRAVAVGAPGSAAELAEHALRLTPSDDVDDIRRRTIVAARAHWAAGNGAHARSMALELLARVAPGRPRAEALLLLEEVESLEHAVPLLTEALSEADGDAKLQAAVHQQLALTGRLTQGRQWAVGHARAAIELAERAGDETLLAAALSTLGLVRFDSGEADAERLVVRAFELASVSSDASHRRDAAFVLGHVLLWSAQLDRARTVFEAQYEEWKDRDEPASAEALWYLTHVELRAGRWAAAADYAERAHEVAVQYGGEMPQHFFALSLVALHRGELERARALATHGHELAARQGAQLAGLVAVPGVVDLWAGDPVAAVAALVAADEVADAAGSREPNFRWWRGDLVEALLETGRISEAAAVLDGWEDAATRLGRRWTLAHVRRCRGLVCAARADVDGSVTLLRQAVALHEDVGDPFGRARALLALGVAERRALQKRAARQHLESARDAFAALGAASWVARAGTELGRVGGRSRTDGLTAAETRVAALVAAGRTNREVAAALFLSERTVASHLTRLYTKLGVRSRTELATKYQTF